MRYRRCEAAAEIVDARPNSNCIIRKIYGEASRPRENNAAAGVPEGETFFKSNFFVFLLPIAIVPQFDVFDSACKWRDFDAANGVRLIWRRAKRWVYKRLDLENLVESWELYAFWWFTGKNWHRGLLNSLTSRSLQLLEVVLVESWNLVRSLLCYAVYVGLLQFKHFMKWTIHKFIYVPEDLQVEMHRIPQEHQWTATLRGSTIIYYTYSILTLT